MVLKKMFYRVLKIILLLTDVLMCFPFNADVCAKR